jgi:hypothetical protein
MKTIRLILAVAVTLMITIYVGTATAQMSQYKFKQQFDKAFEYTLNGEHQEASSILQRLHKEDENHGQVAYLLALNEIKLNGAGAKSASYLRKVIGKVSYYHQTGRVEDQSVPVKAWLYLAKSLANTNDLDEAVAAYRNYMSCIQLASIEHKREIVNAIKELKARRHVAAYGIGNELASRKP